MIDNTTKATFVVCPRCHGIGWLDNYSAMIVDTNECPRCKGRRFILKED